MNLQPWLHLTHLVGAMVWFGGGLVLSLIAGRVRARGDAREIHEFAGTLSFFGLRLFAPAVIALFVAGVWLILLQGGDFSRPWVAIGLGLFVVAFLIGTVYLSRVAIQMGQTPDVATATTQLGQWILGQRLILLTLALATLDMVFKPAI